MIEAITNLRCIPARILTRSGELKGSEELRTDVLMELSGYHPHAVAAREFFRSSRPRVLFRPDRSLLSAMKERIARSEHEYETKPAPYEYTYEDGTPLRDFTIEAHDEYVVESEMPDDGDGEDITMMVVGRPGATPMGYRRFGINLGEEEGDTLFYSVNSIALYVLPQYRGLGIGSVLRLYFFHWISWPPWWWVRKRYPLQGLPFKRLVFRYYADYENELAYRMGEQLVETLEGFIYGLNSLYRQTPLTIEFVAETGF